MPLGFVVAAPTFGVGFGVAFGVGVGVGLGVGVGVGLGLGAGLGVGVAFGFGAGGGAEVRVGAGAGAALTGDVGVAGAAWAEPATRPSRHTLTDILRRMPFDRTLRPRRQISAPK